MKALAVYKKKQGTNMFTCVRVLVVTADLIKGDAIEDATRKLHSKVFPHSYPTHDLVGIRISGHMHTHKNGIAWL